MNEQEILNQLFTESPDFLCTVFFSIVEETETQDPLIQAVQKLDLNAQVRIFAAINNRF